MRTSTECNAKAEELDGRALLAPVGQLRDGFNDMAADWRRLGATAAGHERLQAATDLSACR
jgi:hypothetical protein